MTLSLDVPVVIADKAFTIRFSTHATAALGDAWGCKTMGAIFDRLSKIQAAGDVDLSEATLLLWAGLRKHHPQITVGEVSDLLDDNGLARLTVVMEKLSEALSASMPQGEAAAGGRPTPKTRKSA